MNGLLGMHELRGFWVNGRPNAMIVKADADVDGDTGGKGLFSSNTPYAAFIASVFAHFWEATASTWIYVLSKIPSFTGNEQDTSSSNVFSASFISLAG